MSLIEVLLDKVSNSVENSSNQTLYGGMVVKDEEIVQIVILQHKKGDFEGILEHFRKTWIRGWRKDISVLHGILWPMPMEIDLICLARFIVSRGIPNIYSIGCGTGLLEWLLTRYLEKEVEVYNGILKAVAATTGSERKVQRKHEDLKIRKSSGSLDDSGVDSRSESDEETDWTPALMENVKMVGVEVDGKWWRSQYAPPIFLDELQLVGEGFPEEGEFAEFGDCLIFSYFNNMEAAVDYLKRFQGTYVIIIGPTRLQFCAPAPMDLCRDERMPNSEWNLILFQRFGLEDVNSIAVYSRVVEYLIEPDEEEENVMDQVCEPEVDISTSENVEPETPEENIPLNFNKSILPLQPECLSNQEPQIPIQESCA